MAHSRPIFRLPTLLVSLLAVTTSAAPSSHASQAPAGPKPPAIAIPQTSHDQEPQPQGETQLVGHTGGAQGGSTAGHLTQQYYPPTAECWEYNIPVSVSSENNVFELPEWADDLALQDFLTAATVRESAGPPDPVVGQRQETISANIAASFCTPRDAAARKDTIILATHGIGQARSHWNSALRPEEFNFVQHAIEQGYSVWFYDRLGQGESTKVSGFTNQLRTQKEILVSLASSVKQGQFTGTFGQPAQLALMGYSFGSYITHFAVAENPDLADAAVMTAVGYNPDGVNVNGLTRSFVPRVASQQDPRRFGGLDTGYLTWVDPVAQANTYFKFPFYDAEAVAYCEREKQPFGIGEFLTLMDGELDASAFRGAALAITGQPDYIVCDGDCEGIFEEPARSLFPNARFTPYLHPDAGHNFNFHANATGAYRVITDFLAAEGL